jgi:transcriptional antiterminator RfaH
MTFTVLQNRWYALHVRPNYELAVSTRLRELGVEEYLPLHKTSTFSQRNKFNAGPPLFPGYIFSFMNLHAGPRLYSIPGVLRILGYGGNATPIEDHEIAMVRSIANSPLPVEPVPYFQSGAKIYLTAGPLSGVSGTFLRSGKGNQLVVSLPLLRRSLAVTVLAEWVMAEPSGDMPAEIVAR